MWAVMCVCCHVCHTQARSCLSTGWALNRCFAWGFGTAAVLAQGGGGVVWLLLEEMHQASFCYGMDRQHGEPHVIEEHKECLHIIWKVKRRAAGMG